MREGDSRERGKGSVPGGVQEQRERQGEPSTWARGWRPSERRKTCLVPLPRPGRWARGARQQESGEALALDGHMGSVASILFPQGVGHDSVVIPRRFALHPRLPQGKGSGVRAGGQGYLRSATKLCAR